MSTNVVYESFFSFIERCLCTILRYFTLHYIDFVRFDANCEAKGL